MGVLTSQKINSYYELFKAIEVTFSKEILKVTGLVTNQIYLKCVGDFWPCVIFSSSFQGAKVVANVKSGILQKLERANNMASLRFCFKNADTVNPVTFFVNAKSVGHSPYGGSEDMALFHLQFTQRPPDDLIEIMGRILDANVNSTKRREERIVITLDTLRKLRLLKESAIFIQGLPRHCILRDISFSSAKIIMMGVAKFLVQKDAILRLDFDDPKESFLLKGKFLRSEVVEGRKELVSLVLLFDVNYVPMGYKVRMNEYLTQIRPENRALERELPEIKPAPLPQPKAQTPKTDWPSPDEAAGSKPAAAAFPAPNPAAPGKTAKPSLEKTAEDPIEGKDDFDLQLPT